MRRPGPALRVGLFGVAVTLVGYALFATWLGVHAQLYLDARDRATARATGTVVQDDIGDDSDIRVRWTDAEGHTHLQRFGVYDTDRYGKGEHFPVAYAPGTSRGFPADPDETAREDDLIVPVFLGGAVALPLVWVWIWRGLRFCLTARRPGRPMTARVRFGTHRATFWRGTPTTWLHLTTPDGSARWQRFMWHPVLEGLPDEFPVTAQGSPRRPTVVTLPDGTRLVPLGRPRTAPPSRVHFDDHESVRADLRDAFVLPTGTTARPAPPWWRGALTAALGTAIGVGAGFVMSDGTLIGTIGFALSAATLLTSTWALSAPQP
ncbi:hypothetical protein ACIBVL_18325 [Streptomyces sp. NPDC049687]|uniref:hypothetical protein n=1 Tax=Streptomyces sp. NPDC049687 TaxID=3365596 RepID=UPI0037B3F3D7